MSRIDYSRTTIKLTELESRMSAIEKNFINTVEKIMLRITAIEEKQNGKNKNP